MANIKSQIKRIITNNKARDINATHMARLRTEIKKAKKLAEAKNIEGFNVQFVKTIALIDKSVTKGIIKDKNGANKKSSLYRLANSLKAKS